MNSVANALNILAGTTQAHVFAGQAKTVVLDRQQAEAVEPAAGRVFWKQEAERPGRASADPPPKLVQLSEAKAFGSLDQHHSGVGHVHADLHNAGADKQVELARAEGFHHLALPVFIEPTVEETQTIREAVEEAGVHFLSWESLYRLNSR